METSEPKPEQEKKEVSESDFFKHRKLASVQKISSLTPLDQKNQFQKATILGWNVIVDGKPTLVKSTSLHKDPVKMTKQEYWEKLVQHKLARWERKNPKPVQDLFEKVEDWEQQRSIAEERFRDFVVSTYDKLLVTAALLPLPTKDIVLAKIKDCGGGMNGDENAKIAREIAKKAMKKNSKILHCQLLDHKRKEYRIVA